MDTVDGEATPSGVTVDPFTVLLTALALPANQATNARSGLTPQLVQKFGAGHPRLELTVAAY